MTDAPQDPIMLRVAPGEISIMNSTVALRINADGIELLESHRCTLAMRDGKIIITHREHEL